eukprot:s5974_g5.t1
MDWLYLLRPRRAPAELAAGSPLTKRQWDVVKLLEQYLDGCDFLTFEPSDLRAPAELAAGSPLTKRQWDVVKLLEQYLDGCDFLTFEPSDLGRTASKLEDQDLIIGEIWKEVTSMHAHSKYFGSTHSPPSRLASTDVDYQPGPPSGGLEKDFGKLCGRLRGEKATNARSIVASRISMPAAPTFDPGPFLDSVKYHGFWAEQAEAPEAVGGLLEPGEATRNISSGLFAVIKDLERDRLILDGRGANVFEVPLNKWTRFMASAEKVAGIYVPPECGLLCSGRDLKDFFYQFSGANLLTNAKKAFQNEPEGRFWGIELDGIAGFVRPARRRLLSVMDLVFAAASPEDPTTIIRLSGKLKSELWSNGRLREEAWRAGLRAPAAVLGAPRKALGLGSFLGLPVRQVECKAGSKPDSEAPGCLVLFSGVSGTSRALLKHGAPWVISFDSARSPDEVLVDPERRAVVESLISGGLVAVVSLSPPASSFSRAVTPAVRSRRFPLGVPWLRGEMQANVTRGNDVAAWCSKIVQLCEAHGVEWWLDHPDTSWLWQLRCLKEFASPASPRVWRCDLCFFGAPWRKLRGRSSFGGGAWTALSQPHPKGFFEALAIAAARARKWTEAGGKLQLPLQTTTTLHYEARLWEEFLKWCSSSVSDPSSCFSLCPLLAAMALRAFGDWCFTAGHTLSSYRHTIIAVQRRVLGSKPYLGVAWEMVSRWENLEPPVHRCPLPACEPILKAMCLLSSLWLMRRWMGVTLLAFYGLARIGEVLRCKRKDLLLPADLLDDSHGAAYLSFAQSKTSARGRPKVRTGTGGMCFCGIWTWNVLLRHLDVPVGLRLTPGGLRGGGAVQRYRAGAAPSDLQWAMRLRHLGTLEHYLQEVAAISVP